MEKNSLTPALFPRYFLFRTSNAPRSRVSERVCRKEGEGDGRAGLHAVRDLQIYAGEAAQRGGFRVYCCKEGAYFSESRSR